MSLTLLVVAFSCVILQIKLSLYIYKINMINDLHGIVWKLNS